MTDAKRSAGEDELPPPQVGPSAWVGAEMRVRQEEWLSTWSPRDIEELEGAATRLARERREVDTIAEEDFPLPTLGARLRALRDELIKGRGFALLRGLSVSRYTPRELVAIFYGIGAHLGPARVQNARGDILGHVKDQGLTSEDPNVRIYQTNERQSFHTDSCDVVGLMCVNQARQGGESLLVSGDTVFNQIRQDRPDLLRHLLDPIATDRRGEVPDGMLPYTLIPVFSYFDERVTVFYQRQYIESAQRFPDAPRLTSTHYEALDRFDRLCNDPRLSLSMLLEPGDIQFVYNHALLHDRTGFVDWSEPARRRHMLRLWLSIPGDRALPEIFATRFGSVVPGRRGGVAVTHARAQVRWEELGPVGG